MSNEIEIDLNLKLEKVIEGIEIFNLTVDTLSSKSAPIPTSESLSYVEQSPQQRK